MRFLSSPRGRESVCIDIIGRAQKSPLASTKRFGLKSALLAAAGFTAGCQIEAPDFSTPPKPPVLASTENELTLLQLNPPAVPLIMPLPPNTAVKIAQRAHDDPSHRGAGTAFGVDYAYATQGYTPIAGTIHLRTGDCVAGDTVCGPVNCNGGWGNVVELDALDGNKYLFAHCESYPPGVQDDTFVGKGTAVCNIGCTGNANGRHLHFDRVRRNPNGSYTSLGVGSYITYETGSTEPSKETPDSLETCCSGGGCDALPQDGDCRSYSSFNRSEKDILTNFIESDIRADRRIVNQRGGIVMDAANSNNQFVAAYKEVDVNINNRIQQGMVFAFDGSYYGNGIRNPFITTAQTVLYVPSTGSSELMRTHAETYTPRFVNFDMWDYARAHLGPNSGDTLPFISNPEEVPNWSPEWRLYKKEIHHAGRRMGVFLAVNKADIGIRVAILSENDNWTQWTAL